MENLPKKITVIKCNGVARYEAKTRYIVYTVIDENKKEYSIPVVSLRYTRPEKSFDIIDDTSDFVNGFKVVQTANKEYAYVREEDNELLPYRYDIATDFNEYGYAMVGKDNKVSWINKKFEYLCNNGKMISDEINNKYSPFEGIFGEITAFSHGKDPLSKVRRDNDYGNLAVSYFGTDGKFKKFYNYVDEQICESKSKEYFPIDSKPFNDKGYATFDKSKFILLSSGYYLSTIDLIRICGEKGFLDTISSKIEKQEQAYIKFLRDVEENTISLADNLSKINNLETEYKIARIELKQEELKSRYGEYVYERANEEDNDFIRDKSFKYASRKLAYLIKDEIAVSQVIELELFRSLLAKRGIPSYIDYEENVFHYNTNKHVKAKKHGTC